MHTEHLQRVRLGVVALAWFISVCVASAIVFVVMALDLVDADSTVADRLQISAMALGFFTGGMYAGLRAREAPILHGIFIALFSMVVWFVINVLANALLEHGTFPALTLNFTAAVMLVQVGAAVVGARWGYRRATKA